MTGYHLEHQCAVPNSSSYRADMIERVRQRYNAIATDTAPGLLQSDAAAKGRRDSNGATRVGANRGSCASRHNRCRGTTTRAARNTCQVLGIAAEAVVWIGVGCPGCEFMQIQ